MQPTKDIFCAKEQKVTPHTGRVDHNGEYVFTCTGKVDSGEVDAKGKPVMVDCGSFLKFPTDTTPEQLEVLISKEAEQNAGQVSLEGKEKVLAKMLAPKA